MSPEEIEAWFYDHPGVIAYICVLLVGSLISFIALIVRTKKSNRLGRYPVSAWPLSNLDFAVFFFVLLIWALSSGLVVLKMNTIITGDPSLPSTEVIVVAGLIMQLGMLYIFKWFRFHHRSPNEGSLNPRILSLGQCMTQGLFYFLASLPVVYAVAVSWNIIIEFLRSKGFDIDLPVQDAILLLQDTENPFAFFGMLFLAVVVAPVVEENVFRAGIYRFLKGRFPMVLALLISGCIFGLVHGNLLSLPGLIAVGVCLGVSYELSGSLRVAIFFHAFFNLNSVVLFLIMPDGLVG